MSDKFLVAQMIHAHGKKLQLTDLLHIKTGHYAKQILSTPHGLCIFVNPIKSIHHVIQ